MCKMSCLLKSLVAKYPETDISDDAASTDLKTQSSIAKNLAFRYHPMLARLVSILYYVICHTHNIFRKMSQKLPNLSFLCRCATREI